MNIIRAGIAGILVVACGGSDGGSGTPGVDFTCGKEGADRTGTYLMHDTVKSGDCGDVPDTLTRLDVPSTDCVSTTPDRWSDGNCTVERTIHCLEKDGTQSDGVGITTQQDPDGAKVAGTFSLTVSDSSNAVLCIGRYDLSGTRQ